MSYRFKIFPLFLVFLLAGCLGDPYRRAAPVIETTPPPAPVETRMQTSQSEPSKVEEDVQIAAYQPPVQVRPEPVTSAAVMSLQQKANEQQQTGDLVGAASSLERALRIEPRNAHLWNQLAHVRLSQQQFGQAADLAAKSNSLAGADRWLRHDNWQLIAKARHQTGDLSGARTAEQKAASLR